MKQRTINIALAVVCVALAGLLVWQLWPRTKMVNPIQLDASKIVAVDMISYQGCLDRHEYPITITSETDIRELCDLWNGTWATRFYAYEKNGRKDVEWPTGGSATVEMTFHMDSGEQVTYCASYYYFYELDGGDWNDRVYYTFGPSNLNQLLENFVMARCETEAES